MISSKSGTGEEMVGLLHCCVGKGVGAELSFSELLLASLSTSLAVSLPKSLSASLPVSL